MTNKCVSLKEALYIIIISAGIGFITFLLALMLTDNYVITFIAGMTMGCYLCIKMFAMAVKRR